MTIRTWSSAALALAAVLTLSACGSKSAAPPGPGDVFGDAINPGIDYQPFAGSDMTAQSIDSSASHSGSASFRVLVPASGYVGGAFVSATARDLSPFNAVTFWVKASKAATLNVAGLGVDNTPSTPFKTERAAIPVTAAWTKVVIPIPLPAKLTAEKGLFHFAEGSDEGAYTLWFDDIRYEALPAAEIGAPAPAIATETRPLDIGATLQVNGASVTYPTPGAGATISAGNRFFTWASSAAAATVDQDGVVAGVSVGSAAITAKLGTVDATGTTTVNVAAAQAPAVAAPAPTLPAADVISLFSNAYTNVPVGTWSASWDLADVTDVQVAGNDVKKYTNLIFAGIDFTGTPIDASAMTHFHVDVWSPNATKFGVKLVNFGATTTEHIVAWNAGTTPPFVQGAWMSLDVPLADFTGMTFEALGQIILVDNGDAGVPGDEAGTFFIDNVYFHK